MGGEFEQKPAKKKTIWRYYYSGVPGAYYRRNAYQRSCSHFGNKTSRATRPGIGPESVTPGFPGASATPVKRVVAPLARLADAKTRRGARPGT